MKRINVKIKPYTVTKLFLISYLVYNCSLVPIGFYIPRLSVVLLICSAVSLLIEEGKKFRFYYFSECVYLGIFILIASVTGLLLAENRSNVIQQATFLVEILLVTYLICFIADRTGETDIVPWTFLIGSVVFSIYLLMGNGVLIIGTRLSLAEGFNSNTLGVFLMFGGWSLLKICDSIKSQVVSIILSIAGSALLFYLIIQTGSRKSTIGFALVFLFWIIFAFRSKIAHFNISVKIISFIILVASAAFVLIRFGSDFSLASETITRRMQDFENSDGSWTVRIYMIQDAFRVFLNHPIFGVGLDNYRFFSVFSMYSHNTYAEILACTGIVGGIAFIAVIVSPLKVIVKEAVSGIRNKTRSVADSFNIILAVIFLYICMTQICIYNQNLMLILAQLMAISLTIRRKESLNEKC